MSRVLKYAGIGSRETPAAMLDLMTSIAQQLAGYGWFLRTGGALGADSAFANGTQKAQREIHIPWNGYNRLSDNGLDIRSPHLSHEIYEIAAQHHPAWARLSSAVRNFMARNTTIVLGQQLDDPVDMVICWTPNGSLVGGTSHAMKVAKTYGIPTFNLALVADQKRLDAFVSEIHTA